MRKNDGFTIVELVICVVVIAILAAITVMVYINIKSYAQETSVKVDIRNIAKQVDVYRVDNNRYPDATTLQQLGIHVNKQTYGVNPVGATIFYCVDTAGTTFSIVARVKSTIILMYSPATGNVVNYSGSTTAPQLCLDSGIPGPASNVDYTGFTTNGSWNSWVY